MNEKRVVSIGDLVVDIIIDIPFLPINANQNQLIRQTRIEPGGAGNFLIAGTRLGLEMIPLGVIGHDTFGSIMLDIFTAEGIFIDHIIQQKDGSTTTVYVLVDQEGRHVFLGYPGEGPQTQLPDHWKLELRKSDAILAWGYTSTEKRLVSTMIEALQYAHSEGKKIFFDPGPYITDAKKGQIENILDTCYGLLLTEDEVPLLTGNVRGKEAIDQLFEKGLKLICIKRGEKGCVIYTPDETVEHQGFQVEVRDTTAAGDSFAAAFVYAHLALWPLEKVAAFANAMGAAKVSKFGSGRQVPTAEEVQNILDASQIEIQI